MVRGGSGQVSTMAYAAARRPSPLRWLPGLLVTVYLVLLLPSWGPRLPGAGLDGSWVAVLSDSVFSGRQFGSDLVYTFGPLGFLSAGRCAPRTCGLVFWWGLFRALALGLGFASLTAGWPLWRGLAAGLLFCSLLVAILEADAQVFVAGFLFLALTVRRPEERGSPAQVLLVLMLSAAALMKLVHLVAGLWVVLCAAWLTWLDSRKLSAVPWVFVGSTLALWSLMGQRLSALPGYLRNGWELAGGYTEAMALPGPPLEVVGALGCAVLAAIAWRSMTPGRWEARRWVLAAAAAGLFFLAFKLGFVRHTGSRPSIPWLVLVLVAALGLLAPSRHTVSVRRRAIALAAATVCLAGLAIAVQRNTPRGLPGRLDRALRAPVLAVRVVDASLHDPGWLEKRYRQAQRSIAMADPLPEIGGTVDLFGNNVAIPLAHELDYTPRPVFQSFAAYTRRLAKLNGEFYRQRWAPRRVLVLLEGFHGPPASFHDSEALLELFQSYQLEARHGRLLVLERSRRRRPFERRPLAERHVPLGEWVALDQTAEATAVWAEVEVSKTGLGALAQMLYKLPDLTLTARFADGSQQTFWFAPKRGAGFLLSPVIYSNADLQHNLRRGLAAAPERRVMTAFRLAEGGMVDRQIVAVEDGGSRWRRSARVRLTALSREPPPRQRPRNASRGAQ